MVGCMLLVPPLPLLAVINLPRLSSAVHWRARPPPLCLPALSAWPAGFTWDYVFDWTILKYAQQQNSRPSTSRPADGGGAYAAAQPAGRAQEDARDAEAALRRLGLQ